MSNTEAWILTTPVALMVIVIIAIASENWKLPWWLKNPYYWETAYDHCVSDTITAAEKLSDLEDRQHILLSIEEANDDYGYIPWGRIKQLDREMYKIRSQIALDKVLDKLEDAVDTAFTHGDAHVCIAKEDKPKQASPSIGYSMYQKGDLWIYAGKDPNGCEEYEDGPDPPIKPKKPGTIRIKEGRDPDWKTATDKEWGIG